MRLGSERLGGRPGRVTVCAYKKRGESARASTGTRLTDSGGISSGPGSSVGSFLQVIALANSGESHIQFQVAVKSSKWSLLNLALRQ